MSAPSGAGDRRRRWWGAHNIVHTKGLPPAKNIGNVERDKEVNEALTQEGWLSLRFWESDIQKKLENCVENVLSYASPRVAS